MAIRRAACLVLSEKPSASRFFGATALVFVFAFVVSGTGEEHAARAARIELDRLTGAGIP